jgi:hypothetical protein
MPTALATTDGSPSQPGVSIAASFTFSDGTPIVVNSGDLAQLRKGYVDFSLSQPVVLGSIADFFTWLHKQFSGFPDITQDVKDLGNLIKDNPILSGLYNAFMSIYNATITLNYLRISRTQNAYSFGISVTVDLNPPIDFFSFVQFDSIGVMANLAGTTS